MDGATTSGEDAEATVASHEIARLADVGRAAVSNWRRRFPDFPQPVGGTSASPLYSLTDVEAWLTRHGKPFRLGPGDRVWQRIRGAVDELQLGDLVGFLGTFLVYLRRDASGWKTLADQADAVVAERLPGEVARVVPELPGDSAASLDPTWADTSRMVAEAVAASGHLRLLELLCDRYVEVHSRRVPVTPRHVAELMVRVADVEGGVVLDPACGIGTLLLDAHAQGAVELRGQELNVAMARLAAARLLLHGTATRVVAGDSLRADAFPEQDVDAVLCSPPFHERTWGHEELAGDPRWAYGLPPKSEPELAWAQHCLAHVRPAGRVVILMPAGAASRRPGRRIRRNLLRSGALRAVIRLPRPAFAATSAPDVWIMRRPADSAVSPTHVLMVDASTMEATEVSFIEAAWRRFLAEPDGALPDAARAVPIIDLLDDDIDLSPPRYVRRPAEPESTRYEAVRARLRVLAETLATGLPTLATAQAPPPVPRASVDELVKDGLLAIHQAPLRTVVDRGDVPVLTAKDVRRGRAPSGRTVLAPGSVVIEPGDVIIPQSSPEPVVRVAERGGSLLGPHLLLFRADRERLDPYFLAGFLRAAQIASGSGSLLLTRSDLRRARVPRTPVAEQRRYGEVFRHLFSREDQLRELAASGDLLVRLGFMGLADGSLRPTDE